ncbi:zinc finger protein 385C [Tachyglossus aculeatus]|uniref:zinc finger protein 385C n=1 Tax=Tachyglossus aculeatus TaxID=9261 RepID=UPI0018F512B7|nr:zinc finger protein 385C [Tachyglossus aculeatus]
MKRPLSPSPPTEPDPPGRPPPPGKAECPPGPPEPPRAKRERRRPTYTLCDLCNVQLNSAAQAQTHYSGKAHLKRLRQQRRANRAPLSQGPAGAPSSLLAPLPLATRPLQPPLDLKHFLTFHLSGASALGLFPNFHTMDPVQKAVISHTFGAPSPLKKKLFISCNICHLQFNSANQAEAHYKGHKHARKLKAVEAARKKQKAPVPTRRSDRGQPTAPPAAVPPGDQAPSPAPAGAPCPVAPLPVVPAPTLATCAPLGSPLSTFRSDDASSSASSLGSGPEATGVPVGAGVAPALASKQEAEGVRAQLYCPTCKVTVNSASQLRAHTTGAKHRWMAEGQHGPPRRGRGKPLPQAKPGGSTGSTHGLVRVRVKAKAFHCPVCQVHVNLETQLQQHMSSRRHRDHLVGEPPRATFSPYGRLQREPPTSGLQSKLALQKQLTKALASRFVPGPLPALATTPALCGLPGPLTLSSAPTASIFPGSLLAPALFRPAVAVGRTSPGTLVFTPY